MSYEDELYEIIHGEGMDEAQMFRAIATLPYDEQWDMYCTYDEITNLPEV